MHKSKCDKQGVYTKISRNVCSSYTRPFVLLYPTMTFRIKGYNITHWLLREIRLTAYRAECPLVNSSYCPRFVRVYIYIHIYIYITTSGYVFWYRWKQSILSSMASYTSAYHISSGIMSRSISLSRVMIFLRSLCSIFFSPHFSRCNLSWRREREREKLPTYQDFH